MFLPEDGLPDNLTREKYYELGLQYRLAGWVGLAREALSRVVESGETDTLASKASKVLKTQLPKCPVPLEAEQKNIEGYNLMLSDSEKAKQIFEVLMADYPDFEWPFSNTARIKLQEGDISGARGIVKYLLQVNPDLLSAIDLMIKVCLQEENFEEALQYLDRALTHYPHEEEFKQLKLAIKIQTKGKPPEIIPDNLPPEDYLELGHELQAVGRLEDARKSVKLAIKKSEDKELNAKAEAFIKTQLPKEPVAADAQKECIEAFELMGKDRDAAKDALRKLTMSHPEFEWPFLFLGTIYMLEGSISKAEKLIRRVVSNSPDLISAKHLLISVLLADARYTEALDFIEESLQAVNTEDDGLALDLLKAQCQLQKFISH